MIPSLLSYLYITSLYDIYIQTSIIHSLYPYISALTNEGKILLLLLAVFFLSIESTHRSKMTVSINFPVILPTPIIHYLISIRSNSPMWILSIHHLCSTKTLPMSLISAAKTSIALPLMSCFIELFNISILVYIHYQWLMNM